MLKLDVNRNGRSLSLELPMNTNMLTGELRSIGIHEPLDQIHRSAYLLQPTNELGEHFLRIVRPEDSLQAIALACREPEVLAGESRQALVDLIMADRFRDLEHFHDYLQYGPDALHGLIRLTRDGRSVVLPTSNINMFHCFGVEKPMGLTRLAEMELAPVSEFGRQLIAELQPYSDTVATLNEACSLAWDKPIMNAEPAKILHSARTFQMPMDTETMNFYCPLLVSQYDPDTEEYEQTDSVYLARNEDEIRAALRAWTDGKDETEFLDDTLRPKVASLGWEIERIGGEVYGKAVCELRVPLSEAEQAELAQWLSADTSDGMLENFGEYPIRTTDGDLRVRFWDNNSDNYMLPEEEFRAQVLGEQAEGPVEAQGMGGMGGMAG